MIYTVIKGEFHIYYKDDPERGPQPDGDTLKFLPNNKNLIYQLQRLGTSPDFNNRDMINIRFEAIDALETHFNGRTQNLEWAEKARDFVLAKVGFENVVFDPNVRGLVDSVDMHPQEGFILANATDTYGRVIGFVFPKGVKIDGRNVVDGQQIDVEPKHIKASLNYQLIKEGLVYPSFYSSLAANLKDELKQIAKEARAQNTGLWYSAQATYQRAAQIADLDALQQLVLWPKLFRRLANFFKDSENNNDLRFFLAWLKKDTKRRDDTVLLPDGLVRNLHDLFIIEEGNTIMMTVPVEDIVILPDGVNIENPPALGIDLKIIAAVVNPNHRQEKGERVTILNISGRDISDLGGYYIADRQNGKLFLPQNLSLKNGEAETFDLYRSDVKLSNKGDDIKILKQMQGEDVLIDKVSYSKEEARQEDRVLIFSLPT